MTRPTRTIREGGETAENFPPDTVIPGKGIVLAASRLPTIGIVRSDPTDAAVIVSAVRSRPSMRSKKPELAARGSGEIERGYAFLIRQDDRSAAGRKVDN